MNCEFDRALIALHAGGDLPAEEAFLVDKHLEECEACRLLLAEYRSGIGLVADSVVDVRCPTVRLRSPFAAGAVRHWAAVAVLVLVAAAVLTSAPAVAAWARKTFDFGPVTARELTAEEAQQFQQRGQRNLDLHPDTLDLSKEGLARDASGRIRPVIVAAQLTLPEALAAVDYHVLQPRYLPAGYTPDYASVFPNDRKSMVVVYYKAERGQISITQSAPDATMRIDEHVPEGASESVMVSGSPALLVRGAWIIDQDNKFRWLPLSPARLSFTRNGQVITVQHGDAAYPAEELIKIAESLE